MGGAKVERAGARGRRPANRIGHRTRSPRGGQKVIRGHPKSGGSSKFHKRSTIWPPMNANSSIAMSASGAINTHFILMRNASSFLEFVVRTLQSLAQMQHRISLAREQRVHVHTRLRGHLLEAAPFQLVRDEHLPLFL